jgi:hypothetical protein
VVLEWQVCGNNVVLVQQNRPTDRPKATDQKRPTVKVNKAKLSDIFVRRKRLGDGFATV